MRANPARTELAIPIREIPAREARVDRIGGKAAGLVRLVRAGLDVPRAWVLQTAAHDAFLATDRSSVTGLPEAVRDALALLARGLTFPVAVRSSATCEDRVRSAMAGVFRSELGVAAGELENAVRRCWEHAAGHTVSEHLLCEGIDPATIRVAIILQEMVNAELSGVCFTRDPTGARPDVALVSFDRGLADRLMAGESAGETLTIDRRTGEVSGAGLAVAGFPRPLAERLAAAGRFLERKLRGPQDVEWAWANRRLWFLQARPITTLGADLGDSIVWTRELTEERYPDPISPLGWSTIEGVLPVNLVTLARRFGLVARRPDEVARTIRHYVYSNERFFSIPGSLSVNPFTQLTHGAWYLAAGIDVLSRLPATLLRRGPFGVRWLLLTRFFRAFLLPHAIEIRREWDSHLASLLTEMDTFDEEIDPGRLSDRAILARRERSLAVARRYMEPDLAIWVIRTAAAWMLGRIGEAAFGRRDPGYVTTLAGGLASNPTLRMASEVEALATVLATDRETAAHLDRGEIDRALARIHEDPVTSRALDGFLDANGHLTTNWDLRVPTWGEDPRRVLAMVALQVRAAGQRRAGPSTSAAALARCQVREDTLARLETVPWMARFFDEMLETFHEFLRIDEEHHFHCARLFRSTRRLYVELGRRFAERGVLEIPDDIFFLTVEEVREVVTSPRPYSRRLQVRARRASFRRAESARPPDRFRGDHPIPAPAPDASAGDCRVLVGVSGSPGVAVGFARVVSDPADLAAFAEGEILVLASPKPELTPIYAVAGALVAATGSVLSHGLVSAREFRLPAVIGIADATRRIRTGQKVKVDGDQGTVTLDLA